MQVLKGRVEHRLPYSQQTPFNLLGASKCILSLDPWHKSDRKGIISSLQMRKLRLCQGPRFINPKTSEQLSINRPGVTESVVLAIFHSPQVRIVFRLLSSYVSQYITSGSIRPKVFSIWLFTEKNSQSLLQTIVTITFKNIIPQKLWIPRVVLQFHMQERNLCIINPRHVIFYF